LLFKSKHGRVEVHGLVYEIGDSSEVVTDSYGIVIARVLILGVSGYKWTRNGQKWENGRHVCLVYKYSGSSIVE